MLVSAAPIAQNVFTDVSKEVNEIRTLLDIIVGKFNSLAANAVNSSSVYPQLPVSGNAIQTSSEKEQLSARLANLSSDVVVKGNWGNSLTAPRSGNGPRRGGQTTPRIPLSGVATPVTAGSCSFPSSLVPPVAFSTQSTQVLPSAAPIRSGSCSFPSSFVPPVALPAPSTQMVSSTTSLGASGTTTITTSFAPPTAAIAAGSKTQAGVLFSSDPSQRLAPAVSGLAEGPGGSVQVSSGSRQSSPIRMQSTTTRVPQVSSTASSAALPVQNIPLVSGSVVSMQAPSTIATVSAEPSMANPLVSVSRTGSLQMPIASASTSVLGTTQLSARGSRSATPVRLPSTTTVNLTPRGVQTVLPSAPAQTLLPAVPTVLPPVVPAVPQTVVRMGSCSVPTPGFSAPLSSTSSTAGLPSFNADKVQFSAAQQPGILQPMELTSFNTNVTTSAVATQPPASQQMSQAMFPSSASLASLPGAASPTKLQAGTYTDTLFDAVDVNKNGVIDRTEFRAAVKNDVIRPVKPTGMSHASVTSVESGGACACLRSFSS